MVVASLLLVEGKRLDVAFTGAKEGFGGAFEPFSRLDV